MSITTTAGAKFFVGTTAPINFSGSDSAIISAFEADTWTEVGEVESFGDYGDTSNSVTFTSVGDSRVRKLKGAADAGTMSLVVGRDPLDAGQNLLRTNQGTKFEYNFKIEFEDAPSESYTNTVHYFRGLVMSKQTNMGGSDDVTKRTFDIGINSIIVEVDAAEIESP